jgi:hypothetical protein
LEFYLNKQNLAHFITNLKLDNIKKRWLIYKMAALVRNEQIILACRLISFTSKLNIHLLSIPPPFTLNLNLTNIHPINLFTLWCSHPPPIPPLNHGSPISLTLFSSLITQRNSRTAVLALIWHSKDFSKNNYQDYIRIFFRPQNVPTNLQRGCSCFVSQRIARGGYRHRDWEKLIL